MTGRELAIPGAWEISPLVRPDDRGQFFEWFTQRQFAEMTGHCFDLQQANFSVSAAGVLRGLHFAELPPSQAKFVTCLRGALFDVVVDIRVGSPTYGRWVSTRLDDRNRRSVYVSEGLAHGFLALEADSTVMYLCSAPYTPEREHAIAPMDPQLAIDWPSVGDMRMSARDRDAPTLEQAREAGLLPSWEDCRKFVEGLRRA
ncbi:MAG TPA: dTDP-4-dehydrorhamnose 3,5-epimerase [Mycobacterium sp.]|nr:dTDP-4-dehydrorhamnose 3,5-epimerase [Mycobacterium sp.]